MSNSVKVALYVVLVILAGVSGYFAMTAFGQMMNRAATRHSDLEQIEPERPAVASEPAPVVVDTNAAVAPTNATNIPVEGVDGEVAPQSPETGTNTVADGQTTNASAASGTNLTEVPEAAAEIPTALAVSTETTSKPGEKSGRGRIGLWTGLFVVSLLGLGLLIASDVSQYFGNRALKVLYNDDGDGQKNPEYERAEQVWADGDPLEAVRLMREYLNKNPREQHVAIRIAEIYEKDLKNYLAAALEYEEVLKHKLPPDRWGWSAIHLCNLYFKLNQEQKAFDLLRRIVKEVPQTPAADKARKRLEQVEGAAPAEEVSPEPSAPSRSTPAEPESNLPPGFRRKK